MKKLYKIRRCALALLAIAAMVLSMNMTALAADTVSLDFNRTGSVTLTLADSEGNTVTGGEITIYEVASLYLDDGDMAYALTADFSSCTAALDVTDTSLAETLAQYAQSHGVSGDTAAVEKNGTVTFSGLELGLYLFIQTTESEHYQTINPFVVTLPMESEGVWTYVVDASPKVGTVTPIVPDKPTEPGQPTEPDEPAEPEEIQTPEEVTEPETSSEPGETTSAMTSTVTTVTLPQTGQLNWPVPVLAACGLAFFTAGWVLRRTDKKGKAV